MAKTKASVKEPQAADDTQELSVLGEGRVIRFKGYILPDGESEETFEQRFSAGDLLKIAIVKNDTAGKEEVEAERIGDGVLDSVFFGEFDFVTLEEELEALGGVDPTAKKTKAKAAAKAAPKVAEVKPEETATPAKKSAKAAEKPVAEKAAPKAKETVKAEPAAKTTEKAKPAKAVEKAPSKTTEKPALKASVKKGVNKSLSRAKVPSIEAHGVVLYEGGSTFETLQDIVRSTNDPHTTAMELMRRVEMNSYALGGVLSHIKNTGLFAGHAYVDADGEDSVTENNPQGFDDYCTYVVDVNPKTARQLTKIAERMIELEMPLSAVEGIRWTTLRTAIAYMTTENMDEVLEICRNNSRDEVKAILDTRYGGRDAGKLTTSNRVVSQETVKYVRLPLEFAEPDFVVVETALRTAREQGDEGIVTDEQAMLYIASEWLQLSGNVEQLSVEDEEAMLSARLGRQIKIVDAETGEELTVAA